MIKEEADVLRKNVQILSENLKETMASATSNRLEVVECLKLAMNIQRAIELFTECSNMLTLAQTASVEMQKKEGRNYYAVLRVSIAQGSNNHIKKKLFMDPKGGWLIRVDLDGS